MQVNRVREDLTQRRPGRIAARRQPVQRVSLAAVRCSRRPACGASGAEVRDGPIRGSRRLLDPERSDGGFRSCYSRRR